MKEGYNISNIKLCNTNFSFKVKEIGNRARVLFSFLSVMRSGDYPSLNCYCFF